ncbi:hypothetical protein GW17_00043776 [Ensete ventricosum]|nr:hypothetical protein GW17_00043776 [Ensete ventricosum]
MTTLTCQPVAFALPCCQPPTVKGAVGWLTYRVGSTMPPAACWQRHCRLVCYESVGTKCPLESVGTECPLGLVETPALPADLTEARLASDMHLTW